MDPSIIPIPVNAPGVVAFNLQRDMIWLLEQAVVLATLAVVLFTGWAARLRDWVSGRVGGRGWLTLPIVAAACLVIVAIAVLPVAWWREIAHREAWGRPVEGLGNWFGRRGMDLVVRVALASLLLWAPAALIRRMPGWWWVAGAAIATPLAVLTIIATQVWLPPLFEKVEPFPDGTARSEMQAIAARCGISEIPIYVGGTDQGATAAGLGPFSRILMSQSYVDDANANGGDAELVAGFSHELRHYMNDNWWPALAAIVVILFGGALLLHVLGGGAIRLWGRRFGFSALHDPVAFPLALLILAFGWTFIGSPAFNAFQRGHELEADRFALEMTHDNRTQAAAQARVAQGFRVVDYYWLFEVFRANHPSDAERVRLANTWRPWERGQPGRYDGVCKPKG